MTEVYIETLRNYLRGPEWHQSIDIFVSSNAKYFSNINELDHQHYTLWRTFQEIAETILEMALESIGGSLSELENAIDEIQRQPSRGPREDNIKEILEQLSSVSDFQTFAAMMKAACDNEDIGHNDIVVPKQHIDSLLRMGFPIDSIESALKNANETATLEDLVLVVSAHGSVQGCNLVPSLVGEGNYEYRYDTHDSDPNSPRINSQHASEKQVSFALINFAKEANDDGERLDLNELHAKFVIADSILDSFDSSAREEIAASGGVFALVRWAENMKLLLNDIHTAFEEKLPCKAMCFNCKDGLIDWYRQLENERLSIDEASTAGNMLSNSELKRMAELDRIAAMGTADEQLLHSLISMHEDVSKKVDALHRQCGLLVASDRRGIKRESLEELYLYLKHQVASGADLGAISDDLHEHVYSVVSSSKGAEVVNLLLDMHIYEDEQSMLQNKIHSILGSPSRVDAPDNNGLKPSAHSPIGSPQAFFGGENDYGEKSTAFSSDFKAYSSSEPNNYDKFSEQEGGVSIIADSKDGKSMGTDKGPPPLPSAADDIYLAGLKGNHKTALAQLKELLEADKAVKLKALEDKLSRKRALLQRTQQQRASADEKNDGEDIDGLVSEQMRAVAEVEREIEQTQEKLNSLQDSMVSGLKKRCLNELTLARKRHALDLLGEERDAKVGTVPYRLSPEDIEEAHLNAANALKERFCRDQKALLESLEIERAKQRERILKQLTAKRKNKAYSSEGVDKTAEEREALLTMDLEFDAMQSAALSQAQENALLSLAAIQIPISDMVPLHQEDDEDGYLDTDTRTASGVDIEKGRAWLENVDRIKSNYMLATTDLLHRMRVEAVRGSSYGAVESSPGVAEVISKVVCSAFDAQIKEESVVPFDVSKSGKTFNKAAVASSDTARVKAGILEEFERAKKDLDDSFLHAQKIRKDKLKARRSANAGSKEYSGESDGEQDPGDVDFAGRRKEEHILEKMVDNFLGDQPLPKISDVYAQSSPAQPLATAEPSAVLGSSDNHSKPSTRIDSSQQYDDDRSRIKNYHIEKEKSLLMNLENTMAEQKRALEERLRRKKQSIGGAGSALSADVVDLLNQSVEKMTAHFKNLSQDQLSRINFDDLSEYLERSVNGEIVVLPGSSTESPPVNPFKPDSRTFTNSTITRPDSSAMSSQPYYDYDEEDNGADHGEGQPVEAAGVKTPLFSVGRSREEKVAMAGEVKRISMEYNEENQKLDLMMKIQQARQRQQLQRKLFEKNQKKQQQQHDYGADAKSDYNSVEIGANRGLASLKLRTPDSLQPAFKGLPAEAYQGKGAITGTGGGAGYSSSSKVQAQQSMAHRGMNLGPLMRK